MSTATPLLGSTLAQARADWLAGDSSAWTRYAECLAHLEAHLQQHHEHRARTAPERLTRRPQAALRRPHGHA